MDSGASISVPDIPTYMVITQLFNACSHDQHDTWKTLIFASQSEVPTKHGLSVTFFLFNEIKTR